MVRFFITLLTIYFLFSAAYDIGGLKNVTTIQDINYNILAIVFNMFAIFLLWSTYLIIEISDFIKGIKLTAYNKNEQESNSVGNSEE